MFFFCLHFVCNTVCQQLRKIKQILINKINSAELPAKAYTTYVHNKNLARLEQQFRSEVHIATSKISTHLNINKINMTTSNNNNTTISYNNTTISSAHTTIFLTTSSPKLKSAMPTSSSSTYIETNADSDSTPLFAKEPITACESDSSNGSDVSFFDRRGSRQSGVASKHMIFLGGACNPSTWRKDIAIPMFKQYGLYEDSYFNPQVDEWRPELVKIEAEVKRDARILLFVVGDETRGIASMIEAAEHLALAAERRQEVVLVIKEVVEGSIFGGTAISASDVKDVNRGRAYLADIAERHGFMIFKDVESAVEHTIKLVHVSRRLSQISTTRPCLRAASDP